MFLTSDSSFANHTSSGCVKTAGISIWQWLTQRRRSLALEKLGFREIRRSLGFWGLTYYQCRLDVAVHMVLTWPHDLQTVTGSERIWSRCEPTALYHLRTDSRRGAASLDLHHLTYSTPVAWLRLLKPRCSLFDSKLISFVYFFGRLQTMPSLKLTVRKASRLDREMTLRAKSLKPDSRS